MNTYNKYLLLFFLFVSTILSAQSPVVKTPTMVMGARAMNGFCLIPNTQTAIVAHGEDLLLYSIYNGRLVKVLGTNDAEITTIACSPNADFFITGDKKGSLKLWSTKGPLLHHFQNAHTKAINKVILSEDGLTFYSAAEDTNIKIWSIQSRSLKSELRNHQGAVNDLVLTKKNFQLYSVSDDASIIQWDLTSNQAIDIYHKHSTSLLTVDILEGKKEEDFTLVVGTGDKKVLILDRSKGIVPNVLEGHSGKITNVKFSGKGKALLTTDEFGNLLVWDTKQYEKEVIKKLYHNGEITDAAFYNFDKSIVTVSEDKTLKKYDLKEGEISLSYSWHTSPVNKVVFSKDGKTILSAVGDKTVKEWDTETGKHIKLYSSNEQIVKDATYTPDNKSIVAVGGNNSLFYYKNKGDAPITLKGSMATEGVVPTIYCLDISKAGYVIAGGIDKKIRNFDLQTERIVNTTFESSGVIDIEFHPINNNYVAVARLDGKAQIWDLLGQKKIFSEMAGHLDRLTGISFSPDGKFLVTASKDGKAKLWEIPENVTDMVKESIPYPHEKMVNSAVFSPDGDYILTASDDETAKLWTVAGKELLTFKVPTKVKDASFSPNGRMVALAGENGSIYTFNAAIEPKLEIKEITYYLTGGIESKKMKGNDKGYLEIMVENNGIGDAQQVKTIFSLVDQTTPGIEIGTIQSLGTITAGSTQKLQIPLGANYALKDGIAKFELKITEKTEKNPVNTVFELKLEELPQLTLSSNCIFLAKTENSKESTLEEYNPSELNIRIKNDDKERNIEEARVEFKTQEGIYIDTKGGVRQFDLEEIKSGNSTILSFPFTVSPQYGKDVIEIEYIITGKLNGKEAIPYKETISVQKGDLLENKDLYDCDGGGAISELVWINPDYEGIQDKKRGRISKEEEIKISLMLQGRAVAAADDKIKIFVNDRQYLAGGKFGNAEIKRPTKNKEGNKVKSSVRYNNTIKLIEGLNEIQLIVEAEDGEQIKSDKLRIHYANGKPSLHVLAIGTQFTDLKYTSKDARDFARVMRTQQQYREGLFGKVEVREITGRDATSINIKKEVERFKTSYKAGEIAANDYILIFLSSHGFIDDNDNFFIKGSDFDPSAPTTTSIAYNNVSSVFDELPLKTIFMIDACHSGGATGGEATGGKATESQINAAINTSINLQSGIIPFTSSREDQLSYEDDLWQNGAFTEAVLTALSTPYSEIREKNNPADTNHDSIITLGELYKYVRLEVRRLVRDVKRESQEPLMDYRGTDLYKLPFFVLPIN